MIGVTHINIFWLCETYDMTKLPRWLPCAEALTGSDPNLNIYLQIRAAWKTFMLALILRTIFFETLLSKFFILLTTHKFCCVGRRHNRARGALSGSCLFPKTPKWGCRQSSYVLWFQDLPQRCFVIYICTLVTTGLERKRMQRKSISDGSAHWLEAPCAPWETHVYWLTAWYAQLDWLVAWPTQN